MSEIDTGDLVRDKRSGELWNVACVHDYVVFLCRPGDDAVRIDDVHLERQATPEQRQGLLTALAGSSGNGHRPRCARDRLAAADDA
jgi:hypothetical protein